MHGKIVGIYVAQVKEQAIVPIGSVEVRAHRGLIGDRYYDKNGTYSGAQPLGPGREVTFIEEENVIRMSERLGQSVDPGKLRRNVVTRGVRLNDLVGKIFTIGGIRFAGVRLCHPCAHLQKLSGFDVLTLLEGRGGLRADILDDGWLNVGDAIDIVDFE